MNSSLKYLEGAVENSFGSYSCVLDYFAAYEWVGLGGYKEFQQADEKFDVVPLYCSLKFENTISIKKIISLIIEIVH